MRCRDVKRRLIEAVELDPEIIEHLKVCPSCAREAEAGRLLDSVFKSIRERAVTDLTPFYALKAKLETLSSVKKEKEQSIMNKFKKEISSHPRFSFGIVAAACLFAFVLLVPISYNKTVGYNLVMSDINADSGVDPATVGDVVDAMGYAEVQISTSIDDRKLKIIFEDLPSKKAVNEIISAMTSLSQQEAMTEVSPVVIKEMGTIYAQVRDKIDEIRVETKGKTDQEVKEEIEKGLKERGHQNPRVEVITTPDGKREIRIDTDIKQKTDKGEFETQEKQMFIIGEDDSVSIKTLPHDRLEIDTEGKTNAQIEAEVREKLSRKGIENPKVTVKELPDGRREINVEVKEEKKEN
jgi:hypothetical protein